MGKYGEALGIWHLTVGGADLQITPKMGDNYNLLKMLEKAKKSKDSVDFIEKIGVFVEDLIKRDNPPKDDEEGEELKFYIESNITELMKELFVAFRLTTPEKLADIEKGEVAKKLMDEI